MKKILILSLLYSIMLIANGQLSGDYVADLYKKVQYYISFFNDGQYYMDMMEDVTTDILDKRTISIGHYSIEGKEVCLKDKVHNFQMKLIIVNDSLKMEKSFCFMNNKTFGFKSSYVDTIALNWLKDCDSVSINRDRAEYKIQNQKKYPLVIGDYSSEKRFRVFYYQLTINRDSTYILSFKDVLISEGTWNREGVELVLYDACLKHRFYLLIRRRSLISKLLPGDYKSSILEIYPSKRNN
jgi:hypothetical protein